MKNSVITPPLYLQLCIYKKYKSLRNECLIWNWKRACLKL